MKLIGENYVSLVHKGSILKIEKGDLRYKQAAKLLEQNRFEQYVKLFETNPVVEAVKKVSNVEFRIEGSRVFFGEFEVTGPLARKIESMLVDELDPTPFARFIEKLQRNPSARAVHELYGFLGYKDLAITDNGNFLGYKGVNSDYWSKSGNKETKVLKGKVDGSGRIFNGIGEEIEVQRNNVDDNKDNHCSHGLHVGSYDYARGFASKLIMVEVNPEHVVSVPSDCNFQKLRVCAYKVVSDFEREIEAPVANVVENKVVEVQSKAKKAAKVTAADREMVKKALGRKVAEEYEYISVSSVSNSFSPKYVKKATVIAVAKELGYKVEDGWIYL